MKEVGRYDNQEIMRDIMRVVNLNPPARGNICTNFCVDGRNVFPVWNEAAIWVFGLKGQEFHKQHEEQEGQYQQAMGSQIVHRLEEKPEEPWAG